MSDEQITLEKPAMTTPVLPKTLRKLSPADGIAIRTKRGYHALSVPLHSLGEYEAMGVHLTKRGEGFLLNEEQYEVNADGYLKRGDALIGVITEEAYQDHLQRVAQNDAEEGLTVTTEGRKSKKTQ